MSICLAFCLLFSLINSSNIYELLYQCEMYVQNPRETVYKNQLSLGITIEEYIANTFTELLSNLNTQIISNKIYTKYSIKGNDVSFNISLATNSIKSKELITKYLSNNLSKDISFEITPLNAYILDSSILINWKELPNGIITNVIKNNNVISNKNSFVDKFKHIEWYYLVVFAVILIVIIWFILFICCICVKRQYCFKRYESVNNGHYKEDSNMDISKNVWRKKSRLSIKNENDENEIVGFGLDEDDLKSMSIFKNKKKNNSVRIVTKTIENDDYYDSDSDDIGLSINVDDYDNNTPISAINDGIDTPQDKTVTI